MDQIREDMMLPAQWTIYEKYYNENKKAYQQSMQKIVSFDTVQEFSFLMKSTIYARPTDVFVTPGDQNPTIKMFFILKSYKRLHRYENESEEVQIDALFFFKYDIQPEWEDERNKYGGEVQFEIPDEFLDAINGFVQDLLIEIIGCCNKIYEKVNGLRLMDKLRGGFKPHVRLDLWLSFNPKDKMLQEQTSELKKSMQTIQQSHFSRVFEMKEVSHQ